MKQIILLLAFAIPSLSIAGDMEDDPMLVKATLDQLEYRTGESDSSVNWDMDGWFGKDLHKFWFKTEGNYKSGSIDEVEFQTLYSLAIAPFWDLHAGWRGDLRPEPVRNWLALGVKGVAPYFFDVDAAFFLGEGGSIQARIKAEYELLLTQKLIIAPDVELTVSGKDEPEIGTGSGLSVIEAGLRLRYELRREFAPYIGVVWKQLYGQTADYAVEQGIETNSAQVVFGLRCWF